MRYAKAFFIASLVILGLICVIVFFAVRSAESIEPSDERTFRISIEQLVKDYRDNEVAVDQKIAGRAVELRGEVVRVEKNFIDQVKVTLRARGNPSFALRDGAEEAAKAAALVPGGYVTLRCTDMSRFMGLPLGQGCEIKGAP